MSSQPIRVLVDQLSAHTFDRFRFRFRDDGSAAGVAMTPIGAIVAATAVAALGLDIACAQQMATDVELKAAYCLSVTQGMIASTRKSVQEITTLSPGAQEALIHQSLKEGEDRLDRLKLYLLPRLAAARDTGALAGLVTAMKRGEIDVAQWNQTVGQVASNCAQGCKLEAGADGKFSEQAVQCHTACVAKDPLGERVLGCNNVNWLPF